MSESGQKARTMSSKLATLTQADSKQAKAHQLTGKYPGLDTRLAKWLTFLEHSYGNMPTESTISGHPTPSYKSTEDSADVVASYVDAVNAAITSHPKCVYNDKRLVAQSLEWCLYVVREESVRCQGIEDGMEDGGEVVLVLEDGS